MTNSSSRSGSGAGKFWLWVAIALLVALGSYGSYAAFAANPYVSDVGRNGVSKWLFLNDCKQLLRAKLPETAALQFPPPVQRAESVQEKPDGGWTWTSLTLVKSGADSAAAQFRCEHDKKSGKTEITGLQPAQ